VVLWSVSVEIWFSLLFPVFVLLIQKWRTPKVVAGTILVCAAFAYVGRLIPIERVGYFWPFTSGIFGSCYMFLLGMMVCDLYVKAMENPSLLAKHSRLLLPGVVIAIGALYLMHHADFIGRRALGTVGFAVGFSLVLLSMLSGGNVLRRFLENRLLQVLGCMCYSIYAWHGIIMNQMIPPATASLTDTLRLLVPFLLVMFTLSGLSYRYIEFGRERNWKALFLLAAKTPDH
jgi:peptidoglycan/LPS O-acetylase OafA/YrhL